MRAATPPQRCARRPLANRLCDGFIYFFAGWTLLANGSVLAGAGLDRLIVTAAFASMATLIFMGVRHDRRCSPARPGALPSVDEMAERSDPAEPAPAALLVRLRLGVFVLAAGVVLLSRVTHSLSLFWFCAVALAAVAFVAELGSQPRWPTPLRAGAAEVALFALCFCCVFVTSVSHRSDADDAFYVNLAVAPVDHPNAPLLANDTLHGVEDVPMSLPVFRVLSFELLDAAIARVSGLSSLTVAHLLMPLLLAFLVPLAQARLLRLLLPRRWIAAVYVLVAYLLLVGEGVGGYANFAFVRLHQGKSVLLALALPLLTSSALAFGLRPTWRRWIRLAAAQIAAVGLSTTALWLAPLVAMLSLASTLRLRGGARVWRRATLQLAAGLAACIHPVVWALGLRAATERAFVRAAHPPASLAWSSEHLMRYASDYVLGSGRAAEFAFFALLVACCVRSNALYRRFVALFGLVFLLAWSPLAAGPVAAHVTGPDTYFRVFWLLPLPLLLAGLLTAPLEMSWSKRVGARVSRNVALGLAVLGLFAAIPKVHTLSAANRVRLGRPGFKVPPIAFEAARAIAERAGEGEHVLAPAEIARWLPLIHRHPSPLVVRELYIDVLRPRLGAEEIERRILLTRLVAGRVHPRDGERLLADAVDRYPLSVVCLSPPATSWPELRRALRDAHLKRRLRRPEYEIWGRAAR